MSAQIRVTIGIYPHCNHPEYVETCEHCQNGFLLLTEILEKYGLNLSNSTKSMAEKIIVKGKKED